MGIKALKEALKNCKAIDEYDVSEWHGYFTGVTKAAMAVVDNPSVVDLIEYGITPSELAELAQARDEAIKMLAELEKPRGDETETYTTGYRSGWCNGRAELIRYLFKVYDGRFATQAEAERALKDTDHA